MNNEDADDVPKDEDYTSSSPFAEHPPPQVNVEEENTLPTSSAPQQAAKETANVDIINTSVSQQPQAV